MSAVSVQGYGEALSAVVDLGFCEPWELQPELPISFVFPFKKYLLASARS